MLELVKKLCMLDGVSSFEDQGRYYIKKRVAPYADEIYEDVMGNLIVHKKGGIKPVERIMFAAHMDEVGLIIKSITDEGYLRFGTVGGIDTRVSIGKRVLIGEKHVPGVIGIKAVHLVGKEERKSVPKITDMYIDIGAKDKEDAQKVIEIGDYAIFDSDPVEFGDGFLKARAIDDRIGCAVMIRLIEQGPDIDAWYAFTVQEEVGTRGSGPAAFAVGPGIAIILEGTTAGDMPGTEPHRKVCSPGKGAVLPFMDNSAIYDRGVHSLLVKVAEDNGIMWQNKEYVSGGTDAGTVQRTLAGVKVGAISAAVRYIHSPSCVASIKDFEAIYNLASEFLKACGGIKNA